MRRTALTFPLLAAALIGSGLTAMPVGAQTSGSSVQLESGSTPETRPFPDDVFTVADPAQRTGRRVDLPTSGCAADGASACADLALVNQMDGFDVRPRVSLPFTGPIDLASVTPAAVRIEGANGFRTGLTQLVQDRTAGTVYGLPEAYLRQGTSYTLVVGAGLRAADGTAVGLGGAERRVTFTTMTTTNVLDRARAALDDGSAYSAAGIPDASRTLRFDTADNGSRSVFPGDPAGTRIERIDQVRAATSTAGAFTTTPVVNTAKTYAFYGFGSLTSPQYANAAVRIPQVPTTRSPSPVGSARLAVSMVSPAPSASCIRPVVFGHGFTRSKYDVFLAADTLGTSNLAVFATDVVGHGFGPDSSYRVTTATGTVTTGRALGRGRDLTGNGVIDSTEGSATAGAVNSRDALIQTVIDNMVLVRALQRGVDVDGNGTVDTCTGAGQVAYYGQSFGGIYGTMLLGTDPSVPTGVPNVAGGPIPEVSRLGAFRPLLGAALGPLRNGGPGRDGFTESLPLRRDPRVDDPQQGAIPIQRVLDTHTWVTRSGSPEAYAPRLGAGGDFASKKVIFQVAYGDGTVPNPTSAELLRAGDLYDRTWIYRNDRTATATNNPHGFLLDPLLPAHFEGQEQIRRFIATNGVDERDPDTPQKPAWEPAVAKAGSTPSVDYRVQLDCLHYPDPQTGSPQTRTSPAQDCTDRSATVAPRSTPQGSRAVVLPVARRVLDTRAATNTATAGRRAEGRLTVDLRSVVPDAAAGAAVLNITVTGATRRGFVVAFPSGAAQPPTSNVNVEAARTGVDAATQANEAIVRLSQDRKVDLFVATSAHVIVDVVGYLTTAAAANGDGRLQPVRPSRVLDTRTTAAPRRAGDVIVDLSRTAAATATAVVLNVTVARPDARGYVVAHPTGSARPETSNVNVERGQAQANEVLVRVGEGGKVTLHVAGTHAEVIADLVGVVSASPASAQGYVALPQPVRVGDSRTGSHLPRGRIRGPAELRLDAAVPAGATGVVLNVTATGASAPGFVTVYPAGTARPETSHVTFPAGLTQANEVLAGLGTGRRVVLDVGGSRSAAAALVVDLVGYTTEPAA
ncbi:MAG: hypothetical protein JWN57_2739 [Frankiales bacterium]|nr:hypothetical protein [Frankiales bacterium]